MKKTYTYINNRHKKRKQKYLWLDGLNWISKNFYMVDWVECGSTYSQICLTA